jgi:ribulose-5-phosphate 4-epimerase/fuculose-1-phosphate aldolase
MDELRQLRQEVLKANAQIQRAGLVTMHSGNASGIDRQRGLVVGRAVLTTKNYRPRSWWSLTSRDAAWIPGNPAIT